MVYNRLGITCALVWLELLYWDCLSQWAYLVSNETKPMHSACISLLVTSSISLNICRDTTCIGSQITELELMLIEVSVSDVMLLVTLMEGGDKLGGPESCSANCGGSSKPFEHQKHQHAATTSQQVPFDPQYSS